MITLLSLLKYLFVLILALTQYDRGVRFLNSLKRQAAAIGTLDTSASSTTSSCAPVKSDNYVQSTAEEQHLLLQFEQQLVSMATERVQPRPVDANRWRQAEYSPVNSLSDSVYAEVSKVITCSSGLIKTSDSLCTGVKELVPNSLYGVKTATRIILGFRMRLEPAPMSATRFRIKLHDHFHKHLWPALKNLIDFATETREIVFVGYESGGSLASLAAWHAIKQFELLKPCGMIVFNGNNQVKALTWDEIPLFTQKTASKSLLLPQNHSRFLSTAVPDSLARKIAQSSGGIDEAQYFAASGDEILLKPADYADFAARNVAKAKKKGGEEEHQWNAVQHLPAFIKAKHLRDLSQERVEKLAAVLNLHYKHLNVLRELIANNYRSYIVDSLLIEPNSCAASLSHQLATTIFPGSIVSCRVDDFFVDDGTFKIRCSYETTSGKSMAQFLSFDAVLGDDRAFRDENYCSPFMVEVDEIEDVNEGKKSKKKNKDKKKNKQKQSEQLTPVKKVRKYFGPSPVSDVWSNCLFELFEQAPHLAPISPYTVRKNIIYPRCSYTPFATTTLTNNASSSSKNTGCYLRSPNVSHELLQVYKSDPLFFYKTVEPRVMGFPDRCRRVLFNIPFKASDKADLESLQQLAVDYLTQLAAKNPLADSEVTLWRPRDTDSFKTLSFLGSANLSVKDLANRANYELDFENSIVKCLSNPSYPYRDCTNQLNQWVPGACPTACTQTHGTISFLCKQVKSCPAAGYYVSISSEGTLEQLTDIQTTLNRRPNPQFGIFHVFNRFRGYFGNANFNVALFRMPR